MNGRVHVEVVSVIGDIILKWALNKQDGRRKFSFFKIGTSNGLINL
jgi:hypothetical protein